MTKDYKRDGSVLSRVVYLFKGGYMRLIHVLLPMSRYLPIVFLLLLLNVSGCAPAETNIYISDWGSDKNEGHKNAPVATLQAALDRAHDARKDNPRSGIVIRLEEGTYYLEKPVVFTPDDSGVENAPFKIMAMPGKKVVISGGKMLNLKWEPYQEGIYKATTSGEDFDQLFINGQKQIRARYPDYDENIKIFNGFAADAISPRKVKSWRKPEGGFVHAIHKHLWGGYHYKITGVQGDSLLLEGGWQNNRQKGMHDAYRYVKNIFEELDAPGEWYHDAALKTLYYYPSEKVNLESALVEVALLKHLFEWAIINLSW